MKLSIDLFGRTVTALSEEEKLREAMGGIETAEDILREGEAKRGEGHRHSWRMTTA